MMKLHRNLCKENINNEMLMNIYFLIKLSPESTLLLLKPERFDQFMPFLAHSRLFFTFGKLHDTAAKLSSFVAIGCLKGEFPILCYKLFHTLSK